MINILSYIGMNMHSEVCLWTLLGLLRTIFDATLFRVNANLKQVWQMTMPEEISVSVQRILRTMISGVMLVQCFTVYVYLASYIVLLYPVFLEERPPLVLPWLLLAAIRKLLCELLSLALGLGTCVLLGPARPPCIKFVIIKVISIMPAFYMWMLLFNYYRALKIAAAFKRFPAVLPPGDQDYGLELAIRRRRTKSLLGEEQLRRKLVASLYGDRPINGVAKPHPKVGISSRMTHSTDTDSTEFIKEDLDADTIRPNSLISNRIFENLSYEDWFGSEVVLPRASDRILEQFVLMLLRIGAHLSKEGTQSDNLHICEKKFSYPSSIIPKEDNLNCATITTDDAETPPQVGSSKGNTALYMREYPQIFMKKAIEVPRNDNNLNTITIQTRHDSEDGGTTKRTSKRSATAASEEKILLDIENVIGKKYVQNDKKYQAYKSSKSSENTLKEKSQSSKMLRVNYSDMKIQHDESVSGKIKSKPKSIQLNEASKNDDSNLNEIRKSILQNETTTEGGSTKTKKSLESLNEKFYKSPSDSISGELSDDTTENTI